MSAIPQEIKIAVTPLADYAHLFPLPLTPFEKFILQDERPGYPMTFFVELNFHGELNMPAVEQAVAIAAARHPLLIANIAYDRQQAHWKIPTAAEIVLCLHKEPRTVAPINLKSETGLRIFINRMGEKTRVSLEVHHASCDGEGCRIFFYDVVCAYARACGYEKAPELNTLNYERLLQRAVYKTPNTSEVTSTTLWQKLQHAYHFNLLTPKPLAVHSQYSKSRQQELTPLTLHKIFTREETECIQQLTTKNNCTINDIAMSLMFQTIATWNKKVAGASLRQRVRILMPTDMREREDLYAPAVNRVGFAFLSRTIAECDNWSELLPSVIKEAKYARTMRLGLDFLNIMSGIQRLPWLFPWLLRMKRCIATTVLTNLGDTSRRFRRYFPEENGYPVVGNMLLEQVLGTPPLRPETKAGWGICILGGHMAVSLRTDAAYFDLEASQQLLNAYTQAWQTWMHSVPALQNNQV